MRRPEKSGLKTYRAKRDFGITAEPKGEVARKRGNAFVIQKHAATRLHYDLRLELDGVMKSWAVTRGPSLVPGEKRLAVEVEDHPIAYNTFEGTIPKGEYGGGTVMVWDRGHWLPEGDPHRGLAKGHLAFTLEGKKLHGGWHLVRMRRRPGEKRDNWLLIKQDDDAGRSPKDEDILEEEPLSAASGRSMEQIAKGSRKVWHSNRAKAGRTPPKARRAAATTKNNTRAQELKKTIRISPQALVPCLPSFLHALRVCREAHPIKGIGCTSSNSTATEFKRVSITARQPY